MCVIPLVLSTGRSWCRASANCPDNQYCSDVRDELKRKRDLRQSFLGSEQSSDLLLRVDGQTGVVSPEIASIVRVLGNVVGKGILGDKGLGLATVIVVVEMRS